ncbi:hypothetical protein TL16_g09637 [Triparma laevis f. inornata]|uniref:BspA family leucine-rich repeat surface protein n=1 Tax=Triparma laevis f. inornata TaxID=1714386 RepID=A0A9W7BB40_9STRA|nr:hypothetical protein TL16_g09637 [Triparma laevis f. inornata]
MNRALKEAIESWKVTKEAWKVTKESSKVKKEAGARELIEIKAQLEDSKKELSAMRVEVAINDAVKEVIQAQLEKQKIANGDLQARLEGEKKSKEDLQAQLEMERAANQKEREKKVEEAKEAKKATRTAKKAVNCGRFNNRSLKLAVREWCKDSGKAKAEYGHISGWDMSEVTDINWLFGAHGDVGEAAKQLNDDISKWNVDWVEDMEHMFCEAESFNQDLSGWNVEKCKTMMAMFNGAFKFNKDMVKNRDFKFDINMGDVP